MKHDVESDVVIRNGNIRRRRSKTIEIDLAEQCQLELTETVAVPPEGWWGPQKTDQGPTLREVLEAAQSRRDEERSVCVGGEFRKLMDVKHCEKRPGPYTPATTMIEETERKGTKALETQRKTQGLPRPQCTAEAVRLDRQKAGRS